MYAIILLTGFYHRIVVFGWKDRRLWIFLSAKHAWSWWCSFHWDWTAEFYNLVLPMITSFYKRVSVVISCAVMVFQVLQWNARGLIGKWAEAKPMFLQTDCQLLCIQETHFMAGDRHGCQFVYFCGCSGTHNAQMGTHNGSRAPTKISKAPTMVLSAWAPPIVLITVK